jgi:hypothetical protein
MLQMKKLKKKNSAVLLAEGVEIGNQQTLSYQELSGVLGNLLSVIRSHRTGWLEMNPENKQLPIPPPSLKISLLMPWRARLPQT